MIGRREGLGIEMISLPPCGRSPGRPRDDAREQAILDAALELLVEVGYERMSMVAVAARARASKATIYRRWANKDELVIEAVRRRSGGADIVPADTGSLRGDLVDAVCKIVDHVSREDAALIAGVLLAMRGSPDLAAALRVPMLEEKRWIGDLIVQRAMDRDELRSSAAADVFHELMPALLFSRLLITGESLDSAFIEHMIDDVLLPLMTSVRAEGD
ncbi:MULTISPECIES: TetR/AcrR family transcriptional regulator [unclassified Frankia]|uniref:TetR/AcrR family transcriptional regulator n=1 Tax=unclassified Frankia TaxID=2632575 RepID=UPI002AD27510|nr:MULTISPECIES: TetR/AcrR family transcriptional regulator [unclassified Frankia]